MSQGKLETTGGMILAGWGTSCHHAMPQSHQEPPGSWISAGELEQFRMSFTKQILSGTGVRRKPVLVSRTKSDPWVPGGRGKDNRRNNTSTEKDPFCSVCLNPNLSEADIETRRELEREVRLLQSRPSVAYKKHSPRNWTQDNLLGRYLTTLLSIVWISKEIESSKDLTSA